jgi:hypothetical protein
MFAGLVAVLCLWWGGRRIGRLVNEQTWQAIEEYDGAIAPLVLFALLWLIVDPPRANGHTAGGRGLAWRVR